MSGGMSAASDPRPVAGSEGPGAGGTEEAVSPEGGVGQEVVSPSGGRAPGTGMLDALRTIASVGRLHIVAIAAFGTLVFGLLFTGTYVWLLMAVTALDWFLVNLLNRVVDLDEDRINRIRGTDWVARHHRAVTVAGLVILGGSLVLIHLLVPAITPLRILFHTLGVTYNWRLLPGRRRIKDLYFFKNTASGTGFLITLFAYPIVAAGGLSGAPPDIYPLTVALTVAFFLLFEISYEVIYDLRDAEGDRKAGVRTYPVVHGERGAVRIIDGLIAGSLIIVAIGFVTQLLPWRIVIMGVAPLIQLVWYKRALRRGITAADCIGLTWLGAALLAIWLLWGHLGLPGAGFPMEMAP
jgi:4-hydroxybenzoate polyprenyltransferase